jgi:hypothetical protein
MLQVTIEESRVCIGERLSVFFLRTLRVPDDGRTYPLPPALGEFPLHRIEEYADRVPSEWLEEGGIFIPLYQSEAMWLGFEAARWKPNAVKVGLGNINAVSGAAWDETLHTDPQDYLVCPPQPWLDGIKTREGVVRQFVATPLGRGETIESQLSSDEAGGLRLLVFEPRAGVFPDEPPPRSKTPEFALESVTTGSMGLAAGGEITQKIYLDPHGLDAWDAENFASLRVRILNSEEYRAVTGHAPPASPISAHSYTQHGFPWFQIYDEKLGEVPTAERFARVKSLREKRQEHGEPTDALEQTLEVPPAQVRKLGTVEAERGLEDDAEN